MSYYHIWHIGNIPIESETQGPKIWFYIRVNFRCILGMVGITYSQLSFLGIYVCEDALLRQWCTELFWGKT